MSLLTKATQAIGPTPYQWEGNEFIFHDRCDTTTRPANWDGVMCCDYCGHPLTADQRPLMNHGEIMRVKG